MRIYDIILPLHFSVISWVLLSLLLSTSQCEQPPPQQLYSYIVKVDDQTTIQSHYGWYEVIPQVHNVTLHETYLETLLDNFSPLDTSHFISKPLYVSMTAISSRIHRLHRAILTILQGYVLPTKIFLFLSFDSYLLDHGIPTLTNALLCLAATGMVQIVYTQNIGPHRKLLPMLERYRQEDCLIVTLDDDLGLTYNSTILYRLIKTYLHSLEDGVLKSVIALRGRRIGLCLKQSPHITNYHYWSLSNTYWHTEMLVVPIGTGGILYHPRLFHEIVFNPELRKLTESTDDLMFRLATMAANTSVVLGCPLSTSRLPDHSACLGEDKGFDHYFATLVKNGQERKEELTIRYHENMISLQYNLHKQLFYWPQNSYHFYPAGKDNNHIVSDSLLQRIEEDYDHNNNRGQGGKQLLDNTLLKSPVNHSRLAYSLFAVNRKGLNDFAWTSSIEWLKEMKVMDFDHLVSQYYFEREESCYYSNKQVFRSVRKSRLNQQSTSSVQCAIWPCTQSVV